MEANKISIERELKSKSANIIWSLMSTPEGLAKWFADDVKFSGDVFTFTWGNDWSHHEVRTAALLEKKDRGYIRLRWSEDEYSRISGTPIWRCCTVQRGFSMRWWIVQCGYDMFIIT